VLLSMTGYGEARYHHDGRGMSVEVRTINSRYFKLNYRCTDGYGGMESQIEAIVRKKIKRGTVQIGLYIEREQTADDYKINADILSSYRRQLEGLASSAGISSEVALESLLQLPGVVEEADGLDVTEQWSSIEPQLLAALSDLSKMRVEEGRAMAADLRANCQVVTDRLNDVDARTEIVVQNYRNRLMERLNKLLSEFEVTLEPADIIREVAIFAERSDISEEIVRLRSHLAQFLSVMEMSESSGRKLDFITQEMFRETNTIGSKANDSEIAHHVIEIKAVIERMREMIQNVE